MTTPATAQPPARFDAPSGTIHVTVEIAAPPVRVFHALTVPHELGVWWGSPETYRSHDWEVDLRPGGRWSVRTTAVDGGESTVRGEYLTVEPPLCLEYTWLASWDGAQPTTVRIELEPAEVSGVAGTRLVLTHTGFAGRVAAGEMHAGGWPGILAWLAAHVATRGA